MKIDKTDIAIIRHLRDGRKSFKQIADVAVTCGEYCKGPDKQTRGKRRSGHLRSCRSRIHSGTYSCVCGHKATEHGFVKKGARIQQITGGGVSKCRYRSI